MSAANKETAKKFMVALGTGDVATLKAISANDLIAITPGTAAVSGSRSYDVIMQSAAGFPLVIKGGGIRMEFRNLVAEGDLVACHVDGFATMIDGLEYNNHYHNLFFFRDGKICKMIEFCDLVLADKVLGPYLPPKG